jgi:RES domain-containing protein
VDSLPARLAEATSVSVDGVWQRHVSARFVRDALSGRAGNGRWGTENGFPVLYLGRPTESVIVEAYRHLVDPVVDGVPQLSPRALITCTVSVSQILDLRSATNRILADLTMQQLQSNTRDRDAYRACQKVAAVAHQLEFHGIATPAATQMGETLVLFTDRLPAEEAPTRTAEDLWTELPPDPRKPGQERRLRVVR